MNNTKKPGFWIDAGIHAREWISPATALIIISKVYELKERYSCSSLVNSSSSSVLSFRVLLCLGLLCLPLYYGAVIRFLPCLSVFLRAILCILLLFVFCFPRVIVLVLALERTRQMSSAKSAHLLVLRAQI